MTRTGVGEARHRSTSKSGPRTAEGKLRSSVNRVTHGLNSVRLLLATEDVEEYRQHAGEWVTSLGPATAAEHQVVQLVADLMWRLKRVERIEQRRALAVLEGLVELTPEWQARVQARDLTLGLDTLARLVASSTVPVPATAASAFMGGVQGVVHLLEALRGSLVPELWPEGPVCAFLGAVRALAGEIDNKPEVNEAFTLTGVTAADLAAAVRALAAQFDAAVERARTAISTETLLVDDEDRRFERHRRILEASVARQLDLLATVRAVAQPAASGSFERAQAVELRVITA